MQQLLAIEPMLIREICDHLSLFDLGRMAQLSRNFRTLIDKEYNVAYIDVMVQSPEHIWHDCRVKNKELTDARKGVNGNRIKMDAWYTFTHKEIREWNPLWGKRHVYAWMLKFILKAKITFDLDTLRLLNMKSYMEVGAYDFD